jgi:hypothetical protein
MDEATSPTVTGWSNGRWLPSGRVMVIIGIGSAEKKKDARRPFAGVAGPGSISVGGG